MGILLLLLFLFLAEPRTVAQSPQLIRVGLAQGLQEVTLRADVPVEVLDVVFDRSEVLPPGRWTLRAVGAAIVLGDRRYGDVVRVRSPAGRPIQVEERRRAYRGVVEVRRTDRGLTVINELDLESYLYGVLKLEMDPGWPEEAVKAQAVAARTLALANLRRYIRQGFDVQDTVETQLYGGVTHEDPRATAAVDATRGLVLTHGGRPIQAVYHADSGGRTEASENVWGVAYPYLRSVEDPYRAGSPYDRWSVGIPLVQLEGMLRASGLEVRDLRSIVIERTSESGRALLLRLGGPSGSWEVTAQLLRAVIGPNVLRSTRFTVHVEGETAVFEGSGWGHGVGLSQWGARGMAMGGSDFARILRHYYRDVELAQR